MRAAQFFATLMTLMTVLAPATSWSEADGFQFNGAAAVKPEIQKSKRRRERKESRHGQRYGE